MTLKFHFERPEYGPVFEEARNSLPGHAVPWVAELRSQALEKFNQTGLPGPRTEEWRYTDLRKIDLYGYGAENISDPLLKKTVQETLIEGIDGPVLVLVDGCYCEELSSSDLQPLSQALADKSRLEELFKETGSPLKNLNTALMTDGLVMRLDEKLSQPIQLVHITTDKADGRALRTRNLLHLGENAAASLIIHYVGLGEADCWTHSLTDIVLEKDAALDVYVLQQEGANTVHMTETTVEVGAGAQFRHNCLLKGAELSRTEIHVTIAGEGADVNLKGAWLGGAGQSHDVFTSIDHIAPHSNSDQTYRGVLDRGSRSSFQGRVVVAKDAQKTTASQSNKNILLDRQAEANSRPELLIYADDVQCAHGATVGELDEEALFYLQSRGLDEKTAKALLVEAFVSEIFDDIDIAALKERFLEGAS